MRCGCGIGTPLRGTFIRRSCIERPAVPEPILGREAFVTLSRQAVARTPDVTFEVERLVTEGDTVVVIGEWTYSGPDGKVRQPSVSVVDLRDDQIWRDLEYVGLAI